MGGTNIDDRCRRRAFDVPLRFDFFGAVSSHGWCMLAPNAVDAESGTLERTWAVAGGAVRVRLSQPGGRGRSVEMEAVSGRGSRVGIRASDWDRIEREAKHMLRLDEDLRPFHALCRDAGPPFDEAARRGFGRLLRSPTLFEDVVKVLATTNTAWSGTTAMVRNLVELAGSDGCFPAPAAVAAMGPERLRDEARWGYRAPYLAGLAEGAEDGRIDLDAWLAWEGSTEDLESEIREIPGLGPYAAAQVLTLVGRYDRIGVDSVFRSFVQRAHFPRAREPVPIRKLLRVYEGWGEWRMLAYWWEVWSDYSER
jgi:3-methyladenine DNA glycosylase/8-oxoguanine DNA glycosylase